MSDKALQEHRGSILAELRCNQRHSEWTPTDQEVTVVCQSWTAALLHF
uniref:Uncharacterized protein n=1 Tax=Anguilla anguilla TaxID=7936 RepID=A0A0E9UVU4_ANGAN